MASAKGQKKLKKILRSSCVSAASSNVNDLWLDNKSSLCSNSELLPLFLFKEKQERIHTLSVARGALAQAH